MFPHGNIYKLILFVRVHVLTVVLLISFWDVIMRCFVSGY